MYKRILVAVDGSSTSERALHEAISLAKEVGGQLCIVYVVDETTYWDPEYSGPSGRWDALVQEGREILNKAVGIAAIAGIKAETKLIENAAFGRRIAQAIAEEADTWSADLIVAGTHGRRGASRVFLGSTAENIARVADKPLLLMRSTLS